MVVVGWRKKYHKTWCCEWQVWPVHSLIMAIGVTYKAIRWMVSLVLEEVTLKSWRGINFEKTAREYKRWSEISPEQGLSLLKSNRQPCFCMKSVPKILAECPMSPTTTLCVTQWGVTQWCRAPSDRNDESLAGLYGWLTALATCTESTSARPTLTGWLNSPPPWLWETCLSWISNLYVNI